MVKTNSHAWLLGLFVLALLSQPSISQIIDGIAASPSSLAAQNTTTILNSTVDDIIDLLATIGHAVTYLCVAMTTIIFVLICVVIGLVTWVYIFEAHTLLEFVGNFLYWSIYTFPHQLFFEAPVGMDMIIFLSVNIIIFLPIACVQWLLQLPASICCGLTMVALKMPGLSSACLRILLPSMVVDAMVSIAVGVSATLHNWERQGYYKAFRVLVLLPALIFAMFVNAAMYILLFLPITGLSKLWDYFFVEHPRRTGQGVSEEGDTISELNLDE